MYLYVDQMAFIAATFSMIHLLIQFGAIAWAGYLTATLIVYVVFSDESLFT